MPTLENLTKADLRGVLKASSQRRARRYIHKVKNPNRDGRTLTADVRGSQLYQVEIDVEPTGISASCSCPYDWGGFCKHIGAVLLKWIKDPRSFAVKGAKPPPEESELEVTPVKPPPTQRPKQLPFWMTTSFKAQRQAEGQQLAKWLNAIKLQDLRAMAKKQGWRVKGNRKALVVEQVAEQITKTANIRQAFLSLDEEHQRVLRALMLLGEESEDSLELLEQVASEALGQQKLKSYKQISTYTRHLSESGLALPGSVAGGYPPRRDFIPPAIGRHLPPALEGVLPTFSDLPSDQDGRGDPPLRLGDPYPFVRAVNQIALLLEQFPTPLRPPLPRPRLEKQYPGLKRWDYEPADILRVKKIHKLGPYTELILTVPPPGRSLPTEAAERLLPIAGGQDRLEFIFSLLLAVGIFQPGSPVTVWPEVKEAFLRHNELAQRAILARTFFQMQNWSALWEVIRTNPAGRLQLKRNWMYGNFGPEDLAADLAHFRQVALRVLASAPDGQWVALEDLFRPMRTIFPRFDRQSWQGYRYGVSSKGPWFLTTAPGERPLKAKDWELAQGNFIRQIISGPLHWLGLADLRLRDGQLTAVCFHGLADLLWNRTESPPHPGGREQGDAGRADVVTLDGHSITVTPAAINVQAHSLLDKIARLDVATAKHFIYRLDPQATYESFEEGVALTQILNDWEAFLPIPMPEEMRAELSNWWNAYGRVRIYENLTVIEFSDQYALAEMKAVTSLEEHLIAEISPRLVIVAPDAVDRLTAELEKAGYTPKKTEQI